MHNLHRSTNLVTQMFSIIDILLSIIAHHLFNSSVCQYKFSIKTIIWSSSLLNICPLLPLCQNAIMNMHFHLFNFIKITRGRYLYNTCSCYLNEFIVVCLKVALSKVLHRVLISSFSLCVYLKAKSIVQNNIWSSQNVRTKFLT